MDCLSPSGKVALIQSRGYVVLQAFTVIIGNSAIAIKSVKTGRPRKALQLLLPAVKGPQLLGTIFLFFSFLNTGPNAVLLSHLLHCALCPLICRCRILAQESLSEIRRTVHPCVDIVVKRHLLFKTLVCEAILGTDFLSCEHS